MSVLRDCLSKSPGEKLKIAHAKQTLDFGPWTLDRQAAGNSDVHPEHRVAAIGIDDKQ